MKKLCFALVVMAFFASACSGGNSTTPNEPTAAPTLQNVTVFAPATLPVVSTRTDRRAPTLAPTAPPTDLPTATPLPADTATPVIAPTATALPTATRAVVAPPTATLAPAVYVTAFNVDPPAPKSKPAQFLFHVAFLNTVGENVNYSRWRVLIFPKGQTKAVGDPQGASKTIATGASTQDTELWSIKVTSVCEAYTAQPVWEDDNGKQTPFLQPDGQAITLDLQVCP